MRARALSSIPPAPLGWRRTPPTREQYILSPAAVPILSPEEEALARAVLTRFHEQPETYQTQEALHACIRAHCAHHALALTQEQERDLLRTLHLHTFEAGPLTPLLEDPSLEEISLVGIGPAFPVRVYVQPHGWKETNFHFDTYACALHLLNTLARDSGKRLSGQTPVLNALITGNHRLHASIAPVCQHEIEASIRKFIWRPASLNELVQQQVLPPAAAAYLELAQHSDCNLLLVGNTGSGKTTTLNALMGTFLPQDRVVALEETPELQMTHPHHVRLLPNPETNTPLSTLIRETLRMRPDRIVIGEIRFPEEAHAFMEALLAGQGKGTYATFHGQTAREALARLQQFGIRPLDMASINLLLVQRRWTQFGEGKKPREVRRVTEIVEVYADAHEHLKLNPVFTLNMDTHTLEKRHDSILLPSRFAYTFPGKSFRAQWNARTQKFANAMRGM